MSRESYHDYMGRRMREEDAKEEKLIPEDMVILLHNLARKSGSPQLRQCADYISDSITREKNANI